jgi:hypothetical protein
MHCLGYVELLCSVKGGRSHLVNAIVIDDVQDLLLISWHDLIALGVLPKDFPAVQYIRGITTKDLVVPNDSVDKIKSDYSDVLSDKLNPNPIAGPPMHVELKEGAVPRRCTIARQVPLRYQEEADKLIRELVDKKVIVPVPGHSTWISPGFFVPKADGVRMRLVTDYSHLNKWVKRPIHPFPSAKDIIQSIPPNAKWLAKLDAVHGYLQVELDEESSYMTTFLLSSGKWRYVRAPMGLSSSSDEFCLRTDVLIEGLRWAKKIVDDCLLWAETLPQLYSRIRFVLERARKHNITISVSKLEVGSSITFAGFVISDKGIKPDPAKVAAIASFPAPTNITDLRSFVGLTNQLGFFIPDLAQASVALRQLLKKKNAWVWLPEHQAEMDQIKSMLSSNLVVKPFNPALETLLLTDASRLHGLGFALMQKETNGHRLIQCGSCALTSCQSRYSTIELEALAILYATRKCSFYLRGLPSYLVVSDHKPLVGIFQKDLHDLEHSPRLQRIREKLVSYNFRIHWCAGKVHCIADALSRAPVFSPEEDELEKPALAYTTRAPLHLHRLLEAAQSDEYVELHHAMESFKIAKEIPSGHPAKAYAKVWNRLGVHDFDEGKLVTMDNRIVVPASARKGILKLLHESHSGVVKTLATARQLYYWPGITNDITQLVASCSACSSRLPSHPHATYTSTDDPPTSPMTHVAVDLFDLDGQQWLAMVDRYSGFPFAAPLHRTTTEEVAIQLAKWWNDFSWPMVMRSDNGPQFRSIMTKWLTEHNVRHELSSPYHHESQGLAEANVKLCKRLAAKCKETGENFSAALYMLRNTPRADGYSPAQMMFGRRQRTALPTLPVHHDIIDFPSAEQSRDITAQKQLQYKNAHSTEHTPLKVGDGVSIQDVFTSKWVQQGKIVGVRPSGQSFDVELDNGKILHRNRRFLRPAFSEHDTSVGVSASEASSSPAAIRRSSRLATKAPVQYSNQLKDFQHVQESGWPIAA